MITTFQEIDKIKKNYTKYLQRYPYVGIRVVAPGYDDYMSQIGETAVNSYRWEDGNQTDEQLDGASAINIDSRDNIDSGAYYGRRILVLGSDHIEYGEDVNEIVMRDAKILEIIDL